MTLSLSAILPLLGLLATAQAAPVALSNWSETGRVENNTFTANGTAGFTELFGGPWTRPSDGNVVYDSGAIANFTSDVTLDATTNQLRFSFTVSAITATGDGLDNAFRVGFENDGATAVDATIHYLKFNVAG